MPPSPTIYSFLFSFNFIISFSLIAAKIKTVSIKENKAGIRNLAIVFILSYGVLCNLAF